MLSSRLGCDFLQVNEKFIDFDGQTVSDVRRNNEVKTGHVNQPVG